MLLRSLRLTLRNTARILAGMSKSLFPLPEIEDASDVKTVGQHVSAGYQIRARCTHAGCNHNVQINLVVVARYLGGSTVRWLRISSHISIAHRAGVQD